MGRETLPVLFTMVVPAQKAVHGVGAHSTYWNDSKRQSLEGRLFVNSRIILLIPIFMRN